MADVKNRCGWSLWVVVEHGRCAWSLCRILCAGSAHMHVHKLECRQEHRGPQAIIELPFLVCCMDTVVHKKLRCCTQSSSATLCKRPVSLISAQDKHSCTNANSSNTTYAYNANIKRLCVLLFGGILCATATCLHEWMFMKLATRTWRMPTIQIMKMRFACLSYLHPLSKRSMHKCMFTKLALL